MARIVVAMSGGYAPDIDAIVTNARLQQGESILINAASSGVGVPAIQLAKLFGAKPIIGVSGDSAKLGRLKPIGIDYGVNYREENFADAVLKLTDGKGVDIVIDPAQVDAHDRTAHTQVRVIEMPSVVRIRHLNDSLGDMEWRR
jgi:NADPH:quinone reductase-like Zn-dependent oxidoreductase